MRVNDPLTWRTWMFFDAVSIDVGQGDSGGQAPGGGAVRS